MNVRTLTITGLVALATATATLPAIAQDDMGPASVPGYTTWQTGWDDGQVDRHHVILGTVADFKPFRLQIARKNGHVQTIDLKNGTTILPTGMTPAMNQRVAAVGYYSNGTFIANRIILRG